MLGFAVDEEDQFESPYKEAPRLSRATGQYLKFTGGIGTNYLPLCLII